MRPDFREPGGEDIQFSSRPGSLPFQGGINGGSSLWRPNPGRRSDPACRHDGRRRPVAPSRLRKRTGTPKSSGAWAPRISSGRPSPSRSPLEAVPSNDRPFPSSRIVQELGSGAIPDTSTTPSADAERRKITGGNQVRGGRIAAHKEDVVHGVSIDVTHSQYPQYATGGSILPEQVRARLCDCVADVDRPVRHAIRGVRGGNIAAGNQENAVAACKEQVRKAVAVHVARRRGQAIHVEVGAGELPEPISRRTARANDSIGSAVPRHQWMSCLTRIANTPIPRRPIPPPLPRARPPSGPRIPSPSTSPADEIPCAAGRAIAGKHLERSGPPGQPLQVPIVSSLRPSRPSAKAHSAPRRHIGRVPSGGTVT